MEEIFIPMQDGKRIYTRIYNNNYKQTVLYLHGGPGASCSTFQYAAYKLSKYINVVLIDQRGVLRSDKLEKEDKCNINMLIDDCESIRKFLDIQKFIVIGHSFGGFLALLYSIRYPNSVEKVIFENPSFDFIDSIKLIQSKAINILEKDCDHKLLENIKDIDDVKQFIYKWLETPEEIRNQVYYLKPYEEYSQEKKNIMKVDVDSDERWQYSFIHFDKIIKDKNTYKNIIKLIPDLSCKSLLICGEYDPVLSKKYINYYKCNSASGEVFIVKDCGHFIHTEKVGEYLKKILGFVRHK
ncbi:alpha/beta hydrolase [Clostridium chromiireducens]|uniref:prolyl aminopeptidase n=1 Tax=Clostridium chromiireducens TaxID=225345 RepID=A0A399ITP1_9CLOT|nr:alpha/beta hydrolase [Clostridium chromiireducens]RII36458.1 alpha/beta hydrolase [Clostridium chromiireducens]